MKPQKRQRKPPANFQQPPGKGQKKQKTLNRFQGDSEQPVPGPSMNMSAGHHDFQRPERSYSSPATAESAITVEQGTDREHEVRATLTPTPAVTSGMGQFGSTATVQQANLAQQSTSNGRSNEIEGPYISQPILGQNLGISVNSPTYTPSTSDPVSAHVPMKIKEKIWAGEYIDLAIFLKSARDMATETELNGDIAIKGGQLTVLPQKRGSMTNVHVWTSAYIIFMDIMIQKWPNKAPDYLKYMHNIRLASSRGYGLGWTFYDEQFRMRKARHPHSSWSDIDMELWLLYVSTPQRNAHPDHYIANQTYRFKPFDGPKGHQIQGEGKHTDAQKMTCRNYNYNPNCRFGASCKFSHKCFRCSGSHPITKCQRK